MAGFLAFFLFSIVCVIWPGCAALENNILEDKSSGQCGRPAVSQSRIIAGTQARRGSWPWMVSLNLYGYHNCGGTLINPKWVLTAAHCTYRKLPYGFIIVAGEHNRGLKEGSEQTLDVKRIINHPRYSRYSHKYDIALIELKKPVKLDKYTQLVCLPKSEDTPAEGQKCYLSGWGMTKYPGSAAEILQQAILPVVNKKFCNNRNGMLCAGFGDSKKTVACNGDSGGPLVCQEKDGRWVQQGVTSFVVQSCKYYTGFTRIKDHMDWIQKYVR